MKTFEEIEEIIRERIKELNEADAGFCEKRWNPDENRLVRNMMREASNTATFARQELETLLEKLGLPRFKETTNEKDSNSEA